MLLLRALLVSRNTPGYLQHFPQDAVGRVPDASKHIGSIVGVGAPASLAVGLAFRRQHGAAVGQGQEQTRPSSRDQASLVLAVKFFQSGVDTK